MKYLFSFLFVFIFSVTSYASFTINPNISLGKDVNGNSALEIIPFNLSYSPSPDWKLDSFLNVAYTAPRRQGAFNHHSQGIVLSLEWKPVKFLEKYVPIGTFSDLSFTFTKSFSSEYEGNNNDVSYLQSRPYEKLSMGFNVTF